MSDGRDGEEELHRLVLQRREKLEALEKREISGFAYGFDRSHQAAAALRLFEEAEGGQVQDWATPRGTTPEAAEGGAGGQELDAMVDALFVQIRNKLEGSGP